MPTNSVKGFKVGNEVKKYDYDELDNLPENDPDDLAEQIDDLKSDLELNAGNEIIDDWNESTYYRLSSSATSVDINTPVTTGAGGYKSVYVPCVEGDVFYITATGSSTARPYAFLSSANGDNNIISRASNSEYTLEDYKLVAPKNSAYAVFNADKVPASRIIKGELAKYAGRTLTNIVIPWELGNITFSSSGAVYKYDRATRVRTTQGYSIKLHTGDVIGLSDYSSAEYYTAWWDDNGVFHYTGVKTSNYTITQDGEYIFLLRYITEPDYIVSVNSLSSLFFVKMTADATQVYEQANDFSIRHTSNYDTGLNSHLFKKISPKFAMHRGYSSIAPENTIPAFELAGQNGAWGIETDIYETSDGYFVCHHDSTVDRMTDGTGDITTMTLAQIEALTIDAGANIEDYPNLKIPTLEEYLKICRRYGCVSLIEIKSVTNITGVVNIVKTLGLENNVIYLLTNRTNVPLWRYYTSAPIAYVKYDTGYTQNSIDEVSCFSNVSVDFSVASITDETYIRIAHESNMPVIAWITDSEQTANNLFRMGVDVITSNSIPKFST